MLAKQTPLQRLSNSFTMELEIANDEKLENKLAEQYLKRLAESEKKRDNLFKVVVIFDAILSMTITGRSISIPDVSIATSDIPAFTEVIVGISSLAAYIASHTFCVWLCYSNIYSLFVRRQAAKRKIDPELIEYSEVLSDPALKMLRSRFNFFGPDWVSPCRPFSIVSRTHGILNNLFFLGIPFIHFSLIWIALRQIYSSSEINFAYIIFYIWIFVSTLLTFLIWIVPTIPFSFSINGATDK